MRALAEIHSASQDFDHKEDLFQAASAALRRQEELKRLLATDTAAWPAKLGARGWHELVPLARGWQMSVPRIAPLVERELAEACQWKVPRRFCLRDIWCDHMLFLGDKVSGVIDFGAAGWDSFATDIARLLPSLCGDDASASSDAVAAYEAIRPLTDRERQLIDILDRSAILLGPALWFRWIADERRDFRDRDAVIQRVREMIARLVGRTWS